MRHISSSRFSFCIPRKIYFLVKEKMSLTSILVLLVLFFTRGTALAFSVGIGENWTIGNERLSRDVVRINGSVSNWFPDSREQQIFRYTKKFSISEAKFAEDMYFILPPNWANLRITINGQVIFDEIQGGPSLARIFAERVIRFDSSILAKENAIVIDAQGHPLRVGFRNSSVLLSDQVRDVRWAEFRNQIFNDSHLSFILLALLIGLMSLWISSFADQSTGVLRFFALTTLGVIPHHLLSTEFYRKISNSEEFPFKFQMILQLVSWITFLFVLSDVGGRQYNWVNRIRRFMPGSVKSCVASMSGLLLLTLLPFSLFAMVVYPVFVVICFTSLVITVLMRKDTRGLMMMTGTFLCVTTLVSDVTFGDVYLLGHGTALFSLVCGSILASTYKTSIIHGRSFSEIVKYSLPNSVHQRINGLISKGATIETIRSSVSGSSILSIVLIDICDWGKMNDVVQSKIPSGILRQARVIAFAKFEKTFEEFSFDLLKTSGDNMMFVGGLFELGDSKQIQLSARTLQAVRALVNSIDGVNAELRSVNLPMIKVKLSVSMGESDFGLEMYNKRLQFDVQGHPVNTAYRIEHSMDDAFYSLFGRNVAVVSSSVIYPCEDLTLRKRFPFLHKFSDKHGIEYECYVAEQYEDNLKVDDFAQALFGLYSHVKPSEPGRASTKSTKPGSLSSSDSKAEHRLSHRKKLYLNDGFEVTLGKDGKSWKARALDVSESGMAVAIDSQAQFETSQGDFLDLYFNVENHPISMRAEVASVGQLGSGESGLLRFGLKFSLPMPGKSERKWRRFATSATMTPSITMTDPIDVRRSTVGMCIDLSAGGMGVRFTGTDLLLVPGMRKMVSFQIPGEEKIELETEIKHVRTEADSTIRAGLELLGDLKKMQRSCGSYLVSSGRGEVSFADVRDAGFDLDGVRRLLEVKYPDREQEYDQISALRRTMLGNTKVASENNSLFDRFDKHSRQIICKVGDRVVATVRVVFNDGDREKVEHLSYGAEIPNEFFDAGFVECSRLIVHPEFRGDEVLWTLMEEIGRVTLTSGYRYIVQSCSEVLFPLYERFGFRKADTFSESGKTWILNYLDVEAGIRGRSANGIAWALVYSKLSETMQNRHKLKVTLPDKVRMSLLDKTRPMVMSRYSKIRSRQNKIKIK